MTDRHYDAVIVGGGHNGLVTAGYLARAGLSVLVLERRHILGGASVTEDVFPGYRASTCSFVIGLLQAKVVQDLELKRFGLELYQSDVSNFSCLPDGRNLFMWPELDRTLREIDRHHAGDADAYVRFGLRVQRFAEIMAPLVLSQPPSLASVIDRFSQAGESELFVDFFTLSLRDLLDKAGFRGKALRGMLSFLGVVSTYGAPSTPGTAYVYGHHSWGEFEGQAGQYGFARGGMGGLTQALASSAEAYGAEFRTQSEVASIDIDAGKARGVVLTSGERVSASVVVSNADPHRTFLGLVGADQLPDEVVARLEAADYRGCEAHLLVALDRLPGFIGEPDGPGPQHRGLGLLGALEDNYEAAHAAQIRGELPDELAMEFLIESAREDGFAPPGRHLMHIGVQQVPNHLASGTWADFKPEFTKRVVETVTRYAPGFEDHILDHKVISPEDYEAEYGLTGGNIFHGAMTLNQLFDTRPVVGSGGYRTPIAGLYLCGAGTHPGGGVMGANGHNSARRVLADLRGKELSEAVQAVGGRNLMTRAMEASWVRDASIRIAKTRLGRPVTRLASRSKRTG